MANNDNHESRHRIATLTLAALGIVYGDIGTSPLYAMRECFQGEIHVELTEANVLGILSLIFWSLILVVSVKYLAFVMRADNRGEGGILALMTLALPKSERSRRNATFILMGLFGAGLLYGDGIITPAISVLSAVEGIHIATPALDRYVIHITLLILVLLFAFQSHGTHRVGRLFGPVMIVWFSALCFLGIGPLLREPHVLYAVSPHYAIRFFVANSLSAWLVLGVVFLVVTGSEALYADMGHFGPKPIRLAWFSFVLPALLINYFGQGALLIQDPTAIRNPFFLLAPSWLLIPLLILATMATVIASQAVISGAFSLSSQAVQLGYLPRLRVIHTSKDERGQIYVPVVNWLLFIAVVGLVLGFRSSSRLASAYGMAVTTTMVITAILFYVVCRRRWQWGFAVSVVLTFFFLVFDVAFFSANLVKIGDGGWFPLLVGVAMCVVMTTWRRGRTLVSQKVSQRMQTQEEFLEELETSPPIRISHAAVHMSANEARVPHSLTHNLTHNRVLHNPVVLLTISIEDYAWVRLEDRLDVHSLGPGIFRVIAHYGFKQPPNVTNVLDQCRMHDIVLDETTTFFLGRITLALGDDRSMAKWRKMLYIWLHQMSNDPSQYFNLPPENVIEIGIRVEI